MRREDKIISVKNNLIFKFELVFVLFKCVMHFLLVYISYLFLGTDGRYSYKGLNMLLGKL
jgi:hypothetical protein